MMSISHTPAWELAARIAGKEISPLEVMHDTLDRIDRVNPGLNAFVSLRPEAAVAEARALTEKIAAGKPVGPLAGLPLGVKDLEDAAGMVTSYSGHPAASVPAGLTQSALPAGLQIIAPRHRDDRVLQAARAYEKMRPWDDHWPGWQAPPPGGRHKEG